jgi:hypothetical protein
MCYLHLKNIDIYLTCVILYLLNTLIINCVRQYYDITKGYLFKIQTITSSLWIINY